MLDIKLKLMAYYVYTYLNLDKPGVYAVQTSTGEVIFDHEPVYVGKGTYDRMESHVKKCHNEDLENFVRTGNFDFQKIKDELPSHQAYQLESELIYKIGRKDLKKGPLFNKCAGVNLIEQNSEEDVTPLNLEFNRLILTIRALNESKSIKSAADKLEVSSRTLFRYIKMYNLSKVNGDWIQL